MANSFQEVYLEWLVSLRSVASNKMQSIADRSSAKLSLRLMIEITWLHDVLGACVVCNLGWPDL